MEMMKAAVLHAPGDLRCEEIPIPELGPEDVLIKVSACGVCGSDLPRVLTAGTYRFPTVPGHEFGGVVCKVGEKADKDLIGKQVAVIPLIPCRTCKQCETGAFAQCEQYDFLGSRSDGGFAQYVKAPSVNVVPVPQEVAPIASAFLEPVSVALHVVQNSGVGYGDNVAVFGLGAIGNFVAQWAKTYGAAHVFALDVDAKKVEIAKSVGLTNAFCLKDGDAESFIREKTDGRGIDAAFEASGSGAAFAQAIALLRTQGRMGLVGRPTGGMQIEEKTFEKILRSQLTIKGTWSFEFKRFPRHAWEESLRALREGKLVTEPLITHRYPLEKTMDAIKMMAEKSEFVHKIMILPNG